MNGLERFFESLGAGWAYLFLFLSSLAENLFPPMPGDTVLLLGAVLVGKGKLAFGPVYASTTAGSVLGFMLCYAAGFKWGIRLFQRRSAGTFSESNLRRVRMWFDAYGYGVLAVNRFLAGFRAVVAFAAGIVRMDARPVFLFALVSCLLWNGILIAAGIKVGEHWSVVVQNYQRVMFGLLCLAVLIGWFKSYRKKERPLP